MEYKDYYKILGVSKDVNDKAIKRAYRQLARQYHPDKNPGDNKTEEILSLPTAGRRCLRQQLKSGDFN